ncbi:MAG: twitch domain-containing radical SAM protein [Bdellovibrionota bacterium]
MKKLSESQTLCTQLWNHAVVDLSQQRFRACCKAPSIQVTDKEVSTLGEDLFLNHPVFKMDRKEMLAGGKPERCGVCWKMEESTSFSFRQGPEAWHEYFAPYLSRMPNPSRSDFPDNLDIQLDNYCDLKCLYCNEDFSSQWMNEKLRHGDKVIPRSSNVNPELEKNFFRWFEGVKDNFKRIAFLGGEPLISPIFYDYFERILKSYQGNFPEELEFNIITNLNTPSATLEKFITLLERHGSKVKFNINISMEAWGERAELIRANLDFERFKANFEKLAALNHQIVLSTITSVNVLSVSSLYEYLTYITDLEEKTGRQVILYPNLISHPEWLSVDLAHPKFYDLYIKKCMAHLEQFPHHKNYVGFLDSLDGRFRFGHQMKDWVLHKRFLKEMKTLAARRNVSYRDVFKEYDYLWNESSDQ